MLKHCLNSLALAVMLITSTSCAISPSESDGIEKYESVEDLKTFLDAAEENASDEGRKILENSRSMIENQEVVKGSCWSFINAVFKRSGFAANSRQTIFKSKFKGPYAEHDLIKPGDWLYYINHSHRGIDHSAIFVGWIDLSKKEALMISYAGGNQEKPARYKKYDLSHVYNIIRAR